MCILLVNVDFVRVVKTIGIAVASLQCLEWFHIILLYSKKCHAPKINVLSNVLFCSLDLSIGDLYTIGKAFNEQ